MRGMLRAMHCQMLHVGLGIRRFGWRSLVCERSRLHLSVWKRIGISRFFNQVDYHFTSIYNSLMTLTVVDPFASDIWSYKTMKLVIYLWWLRWSKLITFDKLGHWDQDIQPTSVFCEVDKSIAHLFIKYWYVHDISIQFQQSTYTFWRIDDGG